MTLAHNINPKQNIVINSLRNDDKFRRVISCDCSDCGGKRYNGPCKFEQCYYKINNVKTIYIGNLRVTAL